MTYRTVPRTARVPEYGARTFHVKDRERSNIEAAWVRHKEKAVNYTNENTRCFVTQLKISRISHES